MPALNLRRLPLAVRLACAAALFAAWMLAEKIVIEPFELYRFMPFYRVEGVCAWDIGVALLLLGGFVVAPMRLRRTANSPTS